MRKRICRACLWVNCICPGGPRYTRKPPIPILSGQYPLNREVKIGHPVIERAKLNTEFKVPIQPSMSSAEMRQARKGLGLSTILFAQCLGLSCHAIHSMEIGRCPIRQVTAMAIRYLLTYQKTKRKK